MSTEVIYGDFGTGKTTLMLEKMKALAERGERSLFIVPEQFSFDTERTVYFTVGARFSSNVKVTGFSKLSREILTKFHKARPAADDAVKLITMWKAVEKCRPSFLRMNREKNSAGFCSLMLKTVAAFRNSGISPENFRKILGAETGLSEELADKAEDFLNIYGVYDGLLTKELDDRLEDVSEAARTARENDWFRGYHCFFDNFDSFSKVQLDFIAAAASQAQDMTFCFTTDDLHSKKKHFISVCAAISKIERISSFKATKLEKNYRAQKRDEIPVKIFRARTPYEETEIIAAEIHRMVREEGLRYRDILILTAEREYETPLLSRLKEKEIPVFCDFPHPLTDKPIADFVTRVLKSLTFETEELLALAESGFMRFFDGERRRRVLKKEAYSLRRLSAKYGFEAEFWRGAWKADRREDVCRLKYLIGGLTEPLAELEKKLSECNDGEEFSRIFTEFLLNEMDIRSSFMGGTKIGGGEETDIIEMDSKLTEEFGRIWDALCEALSSMAYCLEGEKLSISQYASLLEEILSGINLANPPETLDSVTAGDIERTRKAAPKAVFLVGANEGFIPRRGNLQSAFTSFERENLSDCGIELYDSAFIRCAKENYFAFRAMNLHEKKLIITYPSRDFSGRERERAKLTEIFEAEEVSFSQMNRGDFLNTVSDLKEFLAENYTDDKELSEQIKEIISEKEGNSYAEKLKNSAELLVTGRKFKLSPDTALKLMGKEKYSPTALETAFNCPFSYFCGFGMKIKEPPDADPLTPANYGSAVHRVMRFALEELTALYREDPDIVLTKAEYEQKYGAQNSSFVPADLNAIAESAVQKALKDASEKNPENGGRLEEIYAGMVPRIYYLLKQTRSDMANGGFIPREFEKRVRFEIHSPTLPGGEAVIEGIADRIDVLDAADGAYAGIFDYKTGRKTFTCEGVEGGVNLQPLMYLFAHCESSGDLPAGAGYIRSSGIPPTAAKTNGGEIENSKKIANAWYSENIISGAIFDYGAVKKAFEDEENALREETGASKAKTFRKMISVKAEEFKPFKEWIENGIIVPKLSEILSGDIKALPLVNDGETSCKFCEFRSICGNRDGIHGVREVSGETAERFMTMNDKREAAE